MALKELFQEGQSIETSRLLMKPVCEADAEGLLGIFSDRRVYQYRPGLPRTTIPLILGAIENFRQGMTCCELVAFTVFDRTTEFQIVGLVEIFNPDPRVKQIEIGYTIAPAYWGMGIATECVAGITDYLIWKIGLNRVRATVHIDNVSSQKVLQHNGFTFEGKERQGEFWQGVGLVDIFRFAKLRADYDIERTEDEQMKNK